MAVTLWEVKLRNKVYTFSYTDKAKTNSKVIKDGRFLPKGERIFHGSIRDVNTNRFLPQSNTTKKVMSGISKGINLIKTPGFKPFAAGMGVLVVLGYLLGRSKSKHSDVKPQENKHLAATTPIETPKAEEVKNNKPEENTQTKAKLPVETEPAKPLPAPQIHDIALANGLNEVLYGIKNTGVEIYKIDYMR